MRIRHPKGAEGTKNQITMKTFNRTRQEFTSGQGSYFHRVMPDFTVLGGLGCQVVPGNDPLHDFQFSPFGN
jgi:hypothetical protein